MEKANLERLSFLTQLSRQRELTAEEQAERQQRRAAYLKEFRTKMRAQLDNTVVEYPDGTTKSLRDAGRDGK